MLLLPAAEQDVLVVVGEADLATASSLHDGLVQSLADPPRPVVVELGALGFCDLPGLDALQAAARAAETAGVHLTFRGQSAQLRWLLRPGHLAAGSPGRVPQRHPVNARDAPDRLSRRHPEPGTP